MDHHVTTTTTSPSPALLERARKLSDELLVLVLEVFQEGRRAGAARLSGQLATYCQGLADEFERTYEALSPEAMADIEARFQGLPAPPAVAARFGTAGHVLELVRDELRRLDRASDRPTGERG